LNEQLSDYHLRLGPLKFKSSLGDEVPTDSECEGVLILANNCKQLASLNAAIDQGYHQA
jgi:hypothetical protein